MARVDRTYRLGDLTLRLHCESLNLAPVADAILRHHCLVEPSRVADPDFSFHLTANAATSDLPDSARELATHESGMVISYVDGVRFLRREDATAHIDLASGKVRASLPFGSKKEMGRDVYLFVVFSLLILLQHRGRYGMHAAALARGGKGLLILADSDSGKSTMTMHLVREGWDYVSDDSVLLSDQGGTVEAHALRRDFALDPDAVEQFPEILDASSPMLTDPKKLQVDPDALYRRQRIARCTPNLLLFPEIVDAAESQLDPVTTHDAFLRLLRQSSILTHDAASVSAQMAVLRRLTDQATPFRLRAGRDIKADGQQLSALLATI